MTISGIVRRDLANRGRPDEDGTPRLRRVTPSRRTLLLDGLRNVCTTSALVMLQNPKPSHARPLGTGTSKAVEFIGGEVPKPLADIFGAYVATIRSRIGPSFNARLAIYGVTSRLPAGIPGDPAKDYSSNRKNCGEFRSPGGFPSTEPYALCEDVTCTSEEKTKCCRHYAYCVPYDRFPANELDSVSTVVVSSRILSLPVETIRGILAHELGHAVDFHMFGKRYRLKNKPVSCVSSELEVRLREIDAVIEDVEYRADDLANVLLLETDRQRLCYDRKTRLQSVRSGTSCDTSSSDDHYAHPVLRRPII